MREERGIVEITGAMPEEEAAIQQFARRRSDNHD